MMKRFFSVFLTFVALAGLSTALSAQDVSAANEDTSIEIDGEIETSLFRRDNNMNSILQDTRSGSGSSPGPDARDQSAMLYQYSLGLTADVGNQVTGRLEIENPILDSNGGGAGANDIALIGNDSDTGDNVQLSEAYVEAANFLHESLSLTVGVQGYETDLRGDGNPFFLDIQGSESLAAGGDGPETVLENGVDGSGDPYDARNHNNDAGGLKLTLDAGNNGNLDLFWFTTQENNAANSDGTFGNDNDQHILGAVFNGNLQDSGSYQAVATWFQDADGTASSNDGLWTIGGGAEYDVTPTGNVYGELYVQGGERTGASDQDTSFALDLGYEGDADPLFYDVSVTHVSGDNSSDQRSTDDNEDFVSYEDNDDTMILEDNVLGLDVDTNYQKLQGIIGTSLTFQKQDDLDVELLVAWAQTETELDDAAGNSIDDSLGIETDLTVTWNHSESLAFQLGLARLWSGDFWTDNNGYNTSSDGLDLYTLTTSLNF